jgi:hypothetical protein
VVVLSCAVALLALAAAGAGLLLEAPGGPVAVTTVRGESVELYGEGLYRYDPLFRGAANRGTDAVVLGFALPLLLAATGLYLRNSRRGALLLLGALAWFGYLYANMALGTAFNEFFLVYVLLFAVSLYGFLALLGQLRRHRPFADPLRPLPHRLLAGFLGAAGSVTVVAWTVPLLGDLLSGDPPERLETSTTMVTDALDLAVVAPACFAVAWLLWQRRALGLLLAVPLLVMLVVLGPVIAGQTLSQAWAGVELTTAEIAGPLAGFLVLAAGAAVLLATLLRGVPPVDPARGRDGPVARG